MPLEVDPSENFNDLATLVSIAFAESQQGENIGTGQSILTDEEGNREQSFGPFQVNKFWYKDRNDSGDTSVVNNKYTDVFNDKSAEEMQKLVQDPINAAVAAIIIAIQTLNEILSFKNKKPKNAVMKGMAAKNNKLIAAEVFVIDQINVIIAAANPQLPIRPDTPIFL